MGVYIITLVHDHLLQWLCEQHSATKKAKHQTAIEQKAFNHVAVLQHQSNVQEISLQRQQLETKLCPLHVCRLTTLDHVSVGRAQPVCRLILQSSSLEISISGFSRQETVTLPATRTNTSLYESLYEVMNTKATECLPTPGFP